MFSFNWKWIVVLMLIGGGFFFYSTSSNLALTKQLDQSGIATQATYRGKDMHRGRRGSRTYYLTLEYKVKNFTHTARLSVSSALYDQAHDGSVFNIKYLTEDPTKLMIVGEPLATENAYYISLAIFLVGAIGTLSWVILAILAKRQAAVDYNPYADS